METPSCNSLMRHLPKLAAGLASLSAALYLAFSPRLAPGLYASRLFRPEKFPLGDWAVTEIGGFPVEECIFRAVDGCRLNGWLVINPEANHIVLFSHGNRGNITGRRNLVELLVQSGASVFIYDFRGYGRSEGSPSINGICEDGLMAFDFLVSQKKFRPAQIIAYGESLGTAVTSEIAAERPCGGIILQSGFSSLRRIGIEMLPITRIYPEALYPKPLLNSASRMACESKPLLVIHGEKDLTVPFNHAEEIFNGALEPKTMLRLSSAGHTDIWATDAPAYIAGVRAFLNSLPVDVDVT